jgi:transcriptional regulator with XRE-family HTH domain
MTWSPGPVVTRRRLGGELRRLREGAGLKLEDVARRLECSPSKISRLENGKGVPRWRDVRDMLEVYDVPGGADRERLLDWAKSGQARMWWQDYRDVLPPAMATYVELEWDARRLTAYEPYVMHGLLQTREYARAVLQNNYGSTSSPDAIDRLVEVRMRRQEALAPDHGLTFACVLDESTLHRVVGSPSVQCEQLEHLIAVAEAEHVDVRVLPFSSGLLPSSRDSFAKLEFSDPDVEDVVYIEQPGSAGDFIADVEDVDDRGARLTAIHRASLPEKDSVPLMKEAVRRVGAGRSGGS